MSRESLEAIRAAKTPEELRILLDRALAVWDERVGLDERLAHLSEDVREIVTACKAALDEAYSNGIDDALEEVSHALDVAADLQDARARVAIIGEESTHDPDDDRTEPEPLRPNSEQQIDNVSWEPES